MEQVAIVGFGTVSVRQNCWNWGDCRQSWANAGDGLAWQTVAPRSHLKRKSACSLSALKACQSWES